jgi:WD40 repeat protein/DNA-binding SARP family transcriptional activator
MQITVLGPVEVTAGGRPVAIGAGKPRALLALLALNDGAPVSTERLVQGLWGEDPPPTAAKMVQLYVSQLRKALAGGDGAEIITRGRGYELHTGEGGLDAARFEQLIASGMPREALALWGGPPLADVADEPFAAAEIRRLGELRLTALELAIDRDLAAGRHRDVIGELETLVREEPLRERLQAQRMLALYRSGRQAEALDAYRAARSALVEEIGVEPGPELRELHEAILRQDRRLELPVAEAEQLPPELYAGTSLVGREADLATLREHWRRAHGGAGELVLVAGARGIGKTRLASELATEVHRDGGALLYASGAGTPAPARAALDGAAAARRPTLLVMDDIDHAGDELRAAVDDLARGLVGLPVLVLATAQDADLGARIGADATITLEPLDADGVSAIARHYAGAGAETEIPVARMLAASGGVPQEIHRAAGAWAHGEAARRLGAAAGRAAFERVELRTAEDELAGNVVALRAARERTEPSERTTDGVVVCPFKGLASFDVEDAPFFFGRERLVAEMVARLAGAPLMGIVGPSGSGKSSALRAGLLPALADGVLPGSERWTFALMRPGEHPMRTLEDAIQAAATGDHRLVIAVDQFEELFVACRGERERAAFVDALVAAARHPRRRACVLVAVRADFYGRCAAYPELWRLLGANQVPVGPMRRDELRRAIELPAHRAGLEVEPDLTDALTADVEGEPGALPLLSTALLELWQRRERRRLCLAAYEQSGGVHGAVARLAEGGYQRLDAAQQRLARAILLRLVGAGEGDTVVRARVALEEFPGEAGAVLAELTDSRLLTVSAGEVEVAHEALLREWPRLRVWLEEDAEGRRLHHHLRAAAREWDAGGRDPGELYRGARLTAAQDWAVDHDPELNALERGFLDDSLAASERAHRRLQTVLAGVASLLIVAVIAGAIAFDQRGQARHQAVAAAAQRMGGQALAEDALDRSLLLARQGVALDDSEETRGNLLAALLKSPAVIGVVRGDGDGLINLSLSPDGRTLAFIENDGTLRFVDTRTRRATGRPVPLPGHTGCLIDSLARFDHLQYSPDGLRIAVGGCHPVMLDAATHQVQARLQMGSDRRGGRIVSALRFSPDGGTLYAAAGFASSDPGVLLMRLDGRTGRRVGRALTIRSGDGVTLMPMGDGRRLVTTYSDATETVIRDARTLRPVRRLPVGGSHAALSPDDRTLLVGGRDGSVRFVDLVTGRVRVASGRHGAVVERGVFSADGRWAITAGKDDRLVVWDVRGAAAGEVLAGHSGRVTALAVSGDSRTLYSTALDGQVLVWDLAGMRRLGRPFKVGLDRLGTLPHYALSPDGRILAVGRPDGTVGLFDGVTLRAISSFRVVTGRGAAIVGMGWVPGATLIAVGGNDGFLGLVDPLRGRVVKRLYGHAAVPPTHNAYGVYAFGFSADGRLMITGADDSTVREWALPSGRPIGRPLKLPIVDAMKPPVVGDVSLNPDGTRMAVAVPEGTDAPGVQIFDVATHRRIAALSEDESVWDVARFTPDGRYIVAGSTKGWVRLWSTRTWKPATRILAGHAGAVLWESISPNGRTLATGGADGTVRLWDLPTQRPVGAPLPGLPGRGTVAQFTPDGNSLFALTDAGRAYRWDIRPASWLRHACEVAGRPLTRLEWHDALPDLDYAPACAG